MYSVYRNNYYFIIRTAKRSYYSSFCNKDKNDVREVCTHIENAQEYFNTRTQI